MVTQADPDGAGSLASPVTSYTYDVLHRLIKSTDPESGETEFTYEDNGNLLTLTINWTGKESDDPRTLTATTDVRQ